MLLSDYLTQIRNLVHDVGAVDFPDATLINYINNARNAVALDFSCVTQFIAGMNLIAQQEAYSFNGVIGGANITNGGVNYVTPVVAIAAPPAGGIQATATAVQTAGVVTGITMTNWGQGYITAPAVTITDSTGPGASATATAIGIFNAYNVLFINVIWGNQRYQLRFRGFTLFNAYMRSQLQYYMRPGAFSMAPIQMQQVYLQPVPDQVYGTEWCVFTLPYALVNPTDADMQVLQPQADAVQYYAAFLALMSLQNFGQADYMMKLYDRRVPKIITGTGGIRIPNPYNKNFQRRVART